MASLRDIKKRIRSVGTIADVTKAMEVISLNKMKRTQDALHQSRPYRKEAMAMLERVIAHVPAKFLPTLLIERKVKHRLLVLITTDKGLVGSFNDVLIKKANHWIAERDTEHVPYSIITIGTKAVEFAERSKLKPIVTLVKHSDYISSRDLTKIITTIIKGYEQGKFDSVDIIYTSFKTTLKQLPAELRLLPVRHPQIRNEYRYTIEPSAKILTTIAEHLLTEIIAGAVLEANASEHSARMVTMQNATNNADELKDKLTVGYNKVRQAGITAEISEIIAGAEALT